MFPLGLEMVVGCLVGMAVAYVFRGPARVAHRQWGLVAISAAVVAWWQPYSLVVTLLLVGVTWPFLRRGSGPGASVAVPVAALVVALAAFKYTPWLVSLTPGARPALAGAWVVPFGISFTVFRLIGALMDARALGERPTLRELLLLALFFPTYRAGPIESLRSLHEMTPDERAQRDAAYAARRIFVGLCRKAILADTLFAAVIGPWQEAGIAQLTPTQCLLLPLLYGLYIYWDFSGYTDIAIGIAALLGYRASENFDSPYLSRNMSEFWRRWHITLSEWIRLRLFMKMVGRRSPAWHFYPATLIAMGLCGLWHGAGGNFLAWGLWHGVGLVVAQLFAEAQRTSAGARRLAALPGADTVALWLTFLWVTVGWTLFFLPLGEARLVLTRALRCPPSSLALVVGAAAVGLLVYDRLRRDARLPRVWEALPAGARGLVYGLIVFALVLSQAESAKNFVYFAF